MTLRLYNTLKREKEDFEPLRPGHVGMYVCGPTVYDYAHIGNARPVVVFDVLYRLLKLDHDVVYVRNITDVDDKINAAAKASGQPISAITERTTKAFHEDMAALGTLTPDHEPRATDHIKEMITLTEALLKGGHAYEAEGHVLFDVPSWDDYGKLSRNKRDDIIAGARVDPAPYKKDPADFVLWKPSRDDLPGWDTPWGRCRPGWHLECSAMSKKHLGETFDIHGGGQDLIFPHHENEIAQSRCAHGTDMMANYWLHNGYLMAEGEKMSKSLGNFYTVHELLKEFPGEAIRLVLLQTYYRKPLDFTKSGIAEAKRILDKFYLALRNAAEAEAEQVETPPELIEALNDDINTPLALSHLHEMAGLLNMADDDKSKAFAKGRLLAAGEVLGLLQQNPEDWFKWRVKGAQSLGEAEIEALIAKRKEARANKDFALSDRIRDDLTEKGIVLEDGPQGTAWRRG